MEKKLTRWDFQRELLKIPAATKKIKENRIARKKVQEVFDKYENLISYNSSDKEYYQGLYETKDKLCKALKSGIIRFDGGFLLVEQISNVKKTENNISVFLKNGNDLRLSLEFEWILDLF